MDSELTEQIRTQIEKCKSILIALPKYPSLDVWCAAAAAESFFLNLGKKVVCVSDSPRPSLLTFLPQTFAPLSSIPLSDLLVLELNTSKVPLGELSYQSEENKVLIYLKPKSGQFSPTDIQVVPTEVQHDLILTLNSATLESLGNIYQANPELFFQVPKLNLDTQANNEYYGATNAVDLAASSLSEVLAEIFVNWDKSLITVDIATSLLGGLISATSSFQLPNTTPKTLSLAAELITLGGRQQEVIKQLYKTKDYNLLRLWGRALARLQTQTENSLLISTLVPNDFTKTQTNKEQLEPLLYELLENVSGFSSLALIAEIQAGQVDVFIAALPHVSLQKISETFNVRIDAKPILAHYQSISFTVRASSAEEVATKLSRAFSETAS